MKYTYTIEAVMVVTHVDKYVVQFVIYSPNKLTEEQIKKKILMRDVDESKILEEYKGYSDYDIERIEYIIENDGNTAKEII